MADKEQMIPIKLLAAYWPKEDERVDAGGIVEVPISKALDLISEHKAVRADPMPGQAA